MAQTVSSIMTPDPITIAPATSVAEAARAMRDADVGAVVVADDERVIGLLTDRDITVRAVAGGRDPESTPVDAVCTKELTALSPDDDLARAVQLMRDTSVRRLPVLDDGRPVGILSLGDLALELDRQSALADISGAAPNR